jgi:hypothetical protein
VPIYNDNSNLGFKDLACDVLFNIALFRHGYRCKKRSENLLILFKFFGGINRRVGG